MKVGEYVLYLYCSNCWGKPVYRYWGSVYYAGETKGRCYARAREDGWVISRGHDLCPECSKKKDRNK